MMAGRYDEAVAAFDEALRVKPDHALAQERRQVATARKHLSPQLEGYSTSGRPPSSRTTCCTTASATLPRSSAGSTRRWRRTGRQSR
jgi:hypothetical protein